MKGLEQTDVLVLTVHFFFRDASVIRTPFYMMEFLDGRIFEEDWLPDITPEERGLMLVTPFFAMSKSGSCSYANGNNDDKMEGCSTGLGKLHSVNL